MSSALMQDDRPKPATIAAWEALEPRCQNLSDPLFYWAEQKPQAVAFIDGPERMTYGELAGLVGKAAVYLDGTGIRAGDRIAISLTNSIDHFILLLALLRLGATTMEVAYNARQPPSPEFLTKFAVKRIFIEPIAAPVAGVPSIKLDAGWRKQIEECRGDRRHVGDGDSMFTIQLSSGTTGQVKGNLTTHRRHFQRMRAFTELMSDVYVTEPPATFLLTGGIAFATFLQRMLSHLFVGGPIAILPRYLHDIDLIKAIGTWDDAYCSVTSAICHTLIAAAPRQGVLFPRLRAFTSAGSALHAQEKLAMLERVSPHFYEAYGTSGFGTITTLRPDEMRERPESVGRAPSSVELQVVDEEGRTVPPGSIGRLRCRGTEGSGFADDSAAAGDENYCDGWYYPGDWASLDQAGYLYLSGRSADVLSRNGVSIFASEIESVIAQHPAVREVAVVGIPEPRLGDRIVALVVPRGQLPHEVLAAHCRTHLPRDRWPDRVFYAPALPKTAGGKLDRLSVKAAVIEQAKDRIGAIQTSEHRVADHGVGQ